MRALIDARDTSEVGTLQAQLSAIRAAIQKYPLVSANKAILAQGLGDPAWNAVRPPLVALSSDATAALLSSLASIRFTLPSPRQPMATA